MQNARSIVCMQKCSVPPRTALDSSEELYAGSRHRDAVVRVISEQSGCKSERRPKIREGSPGSRPYTVSARLAVDSVRYRPRTHCNTPPPKKKAVVCACSPGLAAQGASEVGRLRQEYRVHQSAPDSGCVSRILVIGGWRVEVNFILERFDEVACRIRGI